MPDDLKQEIEALRAEVARLNDHRFLRTYNSVPRFLLFSFMRGLAVGLGTVLGATLLLSMLISILAQIEFVPILGEWAREITKIVQEAR